MVRMVRTVRSLADRTFQPRPRPLDKREKQDDLIRWGTLMALTFLQCYRHSLDALAAAFEAGEDVGTCILALEQAHAEHLQQRDAKEKSVASAR